MRPTIRAILFGVVVALLLPLRASAQTLQQICPGAPDGTGALWGQVIDIDADLVLPGARVVASWSYDGEEQSSEVQVGAEGIYAMCLPLETSMSVHASFASTAGSPLEVTMTEELTQQNLSLSMSKGLGRFETERLWMCINGGESDINTQFSRLLRCDTNWQPLERCPKVELGRITVQPVGAGSGMLKEMIEQLVQEAKRIGANAVVNVANARGGRSFGGARRLTTITAEGVRIEVDPRTC